LNGFLDATPKLGDRRSFSSTGGDRPDWVKAAERDARAAVGDSSRFAKGLASEERLSNVFMNKVMHEFKEEGVGHTKRMEERLAIQLAELHRLLVTVESETAPLIERKEAEAAFTALRVKASMTKQEMIIQREAVFGTSKEAGEILDKKYRVPTLPL